MTYLETQLGPQNLTIGGGARAPGAPLDPHLGRGVNLDNPKLKVPSLDQIIMGGGRFVVFLATRNSKSQVLITFSLGRGVFLATQTSKSQVLTTFHFW